jgi:hypothetical protein
VGARRSGLGLVSDLVDNARGKGGMPSTLPSNT